MNRTIEKEVADLHHQYGADLLRYAASLAGNADAARDAVQETFLRYFIERRYGRAIECPRGWLYRVLRNYLLDRFKAGPPARHADPRVLDALPASRGNPEEPLRNSEVAREIAAALSPREFECLCLRAGGLSYFEIGGALDIQPGTVAALLARVHYKLERAASSPPARGFLEYADAIRYLGRRKLAYPSP